MTLRHELKEKKKCHTGMHQHNYETMESSTTIIQQHYVITQGENANIFS